MTGHTTETIYSGIEMWEPPQAVLIWATACHGSHHLYCSFCTVSPLSSFAHQLTTFKFVCLFNSWEIPSVANNGVENVGVKCLTRSVAPTENYKRANRRGASYFLPNYNAFLAYHDLWLSKVLETLRLLQIISDREKIHLLFVKALHISDH